MSTLSNTVLFVKNGQKGLRHNVKFHTDRQQWRFDVCRAYLWWWAQLSGSRYFQRHQRWVQTQFVRMRGGIK